MSQIATFTVAKNEFLAVLNKLQKIEKSSKKKESTLEVTVYDGFIQLVIPGVQLPVKAFTKGSAKFTILLWYIKDIVNAEKDKELYFTLTENKLKLRGFSFSVHTTFFENDRILRGINLPSNYKYLDIAMLYLSEKYTSEEIKFNNLENEVIEAIDRLKSDIDKVSSTLKKYGFSREDVETILSNKLKNLKK